jgi:hypothetical protein
MTERREMHPPATKMAEMPDLFYGIMHHFPEIVNFFPEILNWFPEIVIKFPDNVMKNCFY